MNRLKLRLQAIAEEARALREELSTLAEAETLDDTQEARFAELTTDGNRIEALAAERSDIERQLRVIEAAERVGTPTRGDDQGLPAVVTRTDPFEVDVRSASRTELRDAAMRIVEEQRAEKTLASSQLDHLDRLLRTHDRDTDGADIARRMLLTQSDAYRSAFMKGVTQTAPAYTAEEVRALNEVRAASLTAGEGGYGVPVLIDPTIILTSGAADAPLLRIGRLITITTNTWKGVASAAPEWSYDTEATEVSDDMTTLTQPSVGTSTARGFIPFSIEIGMDYPGFEQEMRALLEQGYIDLVAVNTITGSGTNTQGIFTALDANTNVEVVVTTDGAFGPVDVLKVWKSLPERFRARASWIMHTDVENEVASFSASGGQGSYFTSNLTADGVPQLRGKPVYTTDYAPEFTGTTGAANILVVGDFSNFVIAQRAGMSVELVPHLFGVTTGMPTGQRGWYAYTRHGYDSVNDNAFRLLQNQ